MFIFGESPVPHISHEPADIKRLVFACAIVPWGEELLFRHIPFQLLKKTEIFQGDGKWWFVILIGLIFGWCHGSYYNIFCQGVVGVALGWIYIKNGYSYLSAVSAHGLYNFLVAFIIPILIS